MNQSLYERERELELIRNNKSDFPVLHERKNHLGPPLSLSLIWS